MACNLITRLFRRRRRQQPDEDQTRLYIAPAWPAECSPREDKLESYLEQVPIPTPEIQTQADTTDFFHLWYQGSYTLTISDIPAHVNVNHIHKHFKTLSGYVSGTQHEINNLATAFDLAFDFATAEEAAMALATNPVIDFGHGVRRTLEYATATDHDNENTDGPPHKKVKTTEMSLPLPDCHICGDKIAGTFSRPCFYCRAAWCHDCLKTNFSTALEDQERFPVKCCARITHFGVGRGVIEPENYEKYKRRFEEHSTAKPVYCANPPCSMFLPPRLAKPRKSGVLCPACNMMTCVKCKVVVDEFELRNHKCTYADEQAAILKQFDYKRCPRCNAGVARMYGCSHIRCSCGAHWCWDCVRPIQICWSKPCDRAREEGEESDDYDIPDDINESDSEDEVGDRHPAAVQSDVGAIAETQQTVEVTPSDVAVNVEAANTQLGTSHDLAENEIHSNNVGTGPTTDAESLAQLEGALRPQSLTTRAPSAPAADQVQTVAQPQTAPQITARAAPQAPPQSELLVNLDAGDEEDWDNGVYDFGDEPIDESWDTWGCLHNFNPVHSRQVFQSAKEWMPNTVIIECSDKDKDDEDYTTTVRKDIACLRCYKTVFLQEEPEKKEAKAEEAEKEDKGKGKERPDSGVDFATSVTGGQDIGRYPTVTFTETTLAVLGQDAYVDKKSKKRKVKKLHEAPKLFNCGKCGVFYCVECKKASIKETQRLLARR